LNHGEDDNPALDRYVLRLFVAGMTSRSQRTIANLRAICAAHLGDRVDLEIVDIYQNPKLAEIDQVVAAPTLLKLQPLPVRRIIGDLSDKARVLRGLGLPDPGQDHPP
jgi:circadian clock protein KaiB